MRFIGSTKITVDGTTTGRVLFIYVKIMYFEYGKDINYIKYTC